MEFDPKLSKQAKERINSKQNWGDTDAGEHVWPYFIYTCTCAVFCEKKLVPKKNNLTRFISLNWKEKEKKTTLNYMILYNIVFLNLISQTKELFFLKKAMILFSLTFAYFL